jgi:hypothetical protein
MLPIHDTLRRFISECDLILQGCLFEKMDARCSRYILNGYTSFTDKQKLLKSPRTPREKQKRSLPEER